MRARVLVGAAVALGGLFFPAIARADQVAVLPFTSSGQASPQDLEAARQAARAAVTNRGHTLPSDAQMLSAQMAVKDGVVDTSQECRAAGRASGSQWTLMGRVEPKPGGYKLELEACQVETGRVESLAREIDPPAASSEIGEMLALLVRPEGINNADIPWEKAGPKAAPAPEPPKPAAPPPPAAPPAPPPPPAVKHAYAEGHPLALGVGVLGNAAVSRPSNAIGPRAAALLEASGGYALEQVPGLELRADVAGAVAGPGSAIVDAGARYAIGVVPTARFFVAPELALGALFPTGGDTSARFYARGSAVLALGLGERVQVEAAGDASAAPGGAGPLVFLGATARALVRF